MRQTASDRLYQSLIICLGLALLPVPLRAQDSADAVSKGDSVDQVLEVLGEPKGTFQKGDFITYVYDQGVVDIVGEKVVYVDLLTEAEVRERKTAVRKAQAEQATRRTSQKRKNVEDGHRVRAQRLADKSFQEKPASERLAYWLSFQRRYPGVDVSSQVSAARADSRGEAESSAAARSLDDAKSRIRNIGKRLSELDRGYTSSRTHWKRRQINRERAVLAQELVMLSEKLIESMDQ
jgi:hypothetical protein